MFQRARNDSPAAASASTAAASAAAGGQRQQKHVARSNEEAVEEQLNARVDNEIEQLLTSFGEIIQSSRIHSSRSIDLSGKAATRTQTRRTAQQQTLQKQANRINDNDNSENDDDDDETNEPVAVTETVAGTETIKDKYAVAQEAYGAQTRAATMVRSVENLLAMVADVRRARLVNDSTALAAMADARRKEVEERTSTIRAAVERLNSAADAAVRELGTVYYNSKYVK
ncbi:hypothetical protein LPJ66_002675 [Kickxella alabastrina]|uniref:Uncharacterized protein n=1 Tax=Kickxella alabastrina TaxID=61397 RepID=A0ACC1IPV3_9FUNG|nr:hypothetical protein LPJ66_002675 [Kickxella alabastrina]